MQDTRALLLDTDFPELLRGRLEILQVNLGYRCNLSCTHCHVNAGPSRTESMAPELIELVLAFAKRQGVGALDLTGGAPELHPRFRALVSAARRMGLEVIDRCNLTVLLEPGHEDLADFLAREQVSVVASLPCYLEENVARQRGKGVYQASVEALRRLNALGYGAGRGLRLDLVYNPLGPSLPPAQRALEADYKRELSERHGIVFDRLLTLANMPVSRFGAVLLAQGQFDAYLKLLRDSHSDSNLDSVMCRHLISVDWRGYVYDCDFNQMLDLPLRHHGVLASDRRPLHLRELMAQDLDGAPIRVGEHCYGCTAGQGSSCGGALAVPA